MALDKRRIVVAGLMIGTLLAAMESTIVTTAMPTVVTQLGGLSVYSWVFSLYILTSTVTVPIWGKISDMYGRRICYQACILIFLLGSALSGAAQTMPQLIAFRAVQGIGAGGLVPLAMTIVGEIFTLEERARYQGLFSGIWGVSSIAGPMIGGWITDNFSWRWIFYINIPIGLLAALVIGYGMSSAEQTRRPVIDYAGAITLSVSISSLLLSFSDVGKAQRAALVATSVVSLVVFIFVERSAREPILPLHLFREKIFTTSVLVNFLTGFAMLGSIPFLTLFAQGVLQWSATESGQVMMPLLLGWVTLSFLTSRLILRFPIRQMTILGLATFFSGFIILAFVNSSTSKVLLFSGVGLMGMGMGVSSLTLMLAVQNLLPREYLGVVTSSTMFFRNIGATTGAAFMGVLMNSILLSQLTALINSGQQASVVKQLEWLSVDINLAFDQHSMSRFTPDTLSVFRQSLSVSIHSVFLVGLFFSLCAFIVAFWIPANSSESLR